jgi:phosphomevalonate kinase
MIGEEGEILPVTGQSDHLLDTMHFTLVIIKQISEMIRISGSSIQPFDLQIDTSEFYIDENKTKLGLGSSAALTVGLIVSISCLSGIDKKLFPSDNDLFRSACDIHFKAQGNRGSGIDIAASVFGGINIYNMDLIDHKQGIQNLTLNFETKNFYMLPVWTGKSASTRDMLSLIDDYRVDSEKNYQDMMSRLVTLSESGCETFKAKNIQDFLDIVHDFYKVLSDFSNRSKIPIISDIHKKIAQIVYSHDAVYKPSGAGGGDVGIAFSDSKWSIETVKKELAKNKVNTLPLHISEKAYSVDR